MSYVKFAISATLVFISIRKAYWVLLETNKHSIMSPCFCAYFVQMCGPLWGQQCGNQDFYPGICAKMSPLFDAQPAFSPAIQSMICQFVCVVLY